MIIIVAELSKVGSQPTYDLQISTSVQGVFEYILPGTLKWTGHLHREKLICRVGAGRNSTVVF